jgi:branched-chain amino acid transport system permease protein
MGINLPVFKSMTFGVSAGIHRRGRRARRDRGGLRVARQLHRQPVHHLPGGRGGRRAGVDPGAIFGGIFIQFVPNIADEISKSAPWAIYGVVLIVFMYLMPTGRDGRFYTLWSRLRIEGLR